MKPGRELDALVAEHVMGYRCNLNDIYEEHPWWTPSGETVYADFLSVPDTLKLPKYSTDIAAAWEIVEKLKHGTLGNSYHFHLTDSITNYGKWEAYWKEKGRSGVPQFSATAETAPHAICLAALKAVGYKI